MLVDPVGALSISKASMNSCLEWDYYDQCIHHYQQEVTSSNKVSHSLNKFVNQSANASNGSGGRSDFGGL